MSNYINKEAGVRDLLGNAKHGIGVAKAKLKDAGKNVGKHINNNSIEYSILGAGATAGYLGRDKSTEKKAGASEMLGKAKHGINVAKAKLKDAGKSVGKHVNNNSIEYSVLGGGATAGYLARDKSTEKKAASDAFMEGFMKQAGLMNTVGMAARGMKDSVSGAGQLIKSTAKGVANVAKKVTGKADDAVSSLASKAQKVQKTTAKKLRTAKMDLQAGVSGRDIGTHQRQLKAQKVMESRYLKRKVIGETNASPVKGVVRAGTKKPVNGNVSNYKLDLSPKTPNKGVVRQGPSAAKKDGLKNYNIDLSKKAPEVAPKVETPKPTIKKEQLKKAPEKTPAKAPAKKPASKQEAPAAQSVQAPNSSFNFADKIKAHKAHIAAGTAAVGTGYALGHKNNNQNQQA